MLELGCGTGRIAVPVARAGAPFVGIDRSEAMLTRARQRLRARSLAPCRCWCAATSARCRSAAGAFALVMAPYGMLQSLMRERDLRATLTVGRAVLPRGGLFGIDLVPDLPRGPNTERRVSLTGRRGRRRR